MWWCIFCISLCTCLLSLSHCILIEVDDPEFCLIAPISSKCTFHFPVQDGCVDSSYLIHNAASRKEEDHALPQPLIFKYTSIYIPLAKTQFYNHVSLGNTAFISDNRMHSSRGSGPFQRLRGGPILQDSQQSQPSHPWLCDLEQGTIFEPQFPYIQSKRIRPDGLSPKSFSGVKCCNSVACCFIVPLNLGESDVI